MGFLHAEQTRRDSECTPEMGPFPIQLVREQSSIKCVAAAYQSSSSFSNTTFHLSLLQSVLLLEPRRIICPQNTKISHLLLLPFCCPRSILIWNFWTSVISICHFTQLVSHTILWRFQTSVQLYLILATVSQSVQRVYQSLVILFILLEAKRSYDKLFTQR